jgi:hypothetical protein
MLNYLNNLIIIFYPILNLKLYWVIRCIYFNQWNFGYSRAIWWRAMLGLQYWWYIISATREICRTLPVRFSSLALWYSGLLYEVRLLDASQRANWFTILQGERSGCMKSLYLNLVSFNSILYKMKMTYCDFLRKKHIAKFRCLNSYFFLYLYAFSIN